MYMKHTRDIRRLSSKRDLKNVELSIRTVIVEINFNYTHVILTIMVITNNTPSPMETGYYNLYQ